jgi:hypothetical protein
MMNVLYIVCLMAPLVIWRNAGGPASRLVP